MTVIHRIKERPFLSLSIVLIIVLRTLFLTSDSLWIDEAFCAIQIRDSFTAILADHFQQQGANPPLYPIMLKIWSLLWGDSEIALRSLSLLFSFISAFALYNGTKNLIGKRGAEWFLFLFALSPPLIYFAQEVRSYGLFILLLSVFYWAWSSFRKSGITLLNALGGMLSLWGMVLSHPFGWFNVGWSLFLYAVHLIQEKRFPSVHEITAGLITYVPVFYYLYYFTTVISKQQEGFWIAVPSLKHLLGGIHFQAGSFPLLFLIGLVVLRWIATKGYRDSSRTVLYHSIGFWSLFTLIPFLLSQFITPIYSVRYTIFSTLFILLIATIQLSRETKKTQSIFAVLFTLFSIYHWGVSKATPTREQWREISAFIHKETPIIGGDNYVSDYSLSYYTTRDFSGDFFIPRELMELPQWKDSVYSFQDDKVKLQLLLSHFGESNTEKLSRYLSELSWVVVEEKEWWYRDQNNQQRSAAQWFLLEKKESTPNSD